MLNHQKTLINWLKYQKVQDELIKFKILNYQALQKRWIS